MRNRYKTQHETAGDWAVIDTQRNNIPIATGLDSEEAEQTALEWNQKESDSKSEYI